MVRTRKGSRGIGSATGVSACAAAMTLAGLTFAPAARASDVHDLQRNLPLEVEDTTATEEGSLQVQASAR